MAFDVETISQDEVPEDAHEGDSNPGEVVPAPPELENHLLKKDRRLRIVRIDAEGYHGWYLREIPGDHLLFSDGGRLDIMGEMLDKAVDRLEEYGVPLYIEESDA